MEAQLEKESRMKQLNSVGNNHSRDSAIDADMQEWDTEIVEISLVSTSHYFTYLLQTKGKKKQKYSLFIGHCNLHFDKCADFSNFGIE